MMQLWENEFAKTVGLDGVWEFRLEKQTGSIRVPGTWEAQGYARRAEGPAIYSRTVFVPADWQGQQIQMQFDAVSYYAEVSVNGQAVGIHTGTWTAFAFDVTQAIRPGEENEITVVVTNIGERFPLRESLVGFLPDVAIMFGGIWQSARLVAFPGPALSEINIKADVSGRVSVQAGIHDFDGGEAVIRLLDFSGKEVAIWHGEATKRLAADIHVEQPLLWCPELPARYTVEITLEVDDKPAARACRMIGFRKLAHEDQQLLFNNESICLRGVLNWGWYPEILCPAPDEATIRDEFRRVRDLGYNMVKLCLYVPSPLYFEIADEEGMLLWLELPLWLPDVTPRLMEHTLVEYPRIMAQVQHHPSIVIYSLGCELEKNVDPGWIAELNSLTRERAHDVLFCDNSGSGEAYGYLGDLADFDDYHFYADIQYFEPLLNHFHRDWRRPRPLIFGEFCDMDDYRDPADLRAQYGGELPWWATEQNPIHPLNKLAYSQQIERMSQLNVGQIAPELVHLSRQQSLMIRKTVLERTRARDGMGGYVVTSIRETPLSTSSMFDNEGRAKYSAEEFRRFNADTVLLIGRGRARRWTRGGDRPAPTEPYSFAAGQPIALAAILAHAGKPLAGGRLSWQVTDGNGAILAEDTQIVEGPFAGGRPRSIGSILFTAPTVEQAVRLRLKMALEWADQGIANEWPLWVFPQVTEWPQGIALYDPAGGVGSAGRSATGGAAGVPDHAHYHHTDHQHQFSTPRRQIDSLLNSSC
ncbi:MAG TPA: hypothetical protein VHP83_26285 [Aggregatilineaceae bacterium]|nr:hypothetical protein [Aggregatilineaceae bacterium]